MTAFTRATALLAKQTSTPDPTSVASRECTRLVTVNAMSGGLVALGLVARRRCSQRVLPDRSEQRRFQSRNIRIQLMTGSAARRSLNAAWNPVSSPSRLATRVADIERAAGALPEAQERG